ncbi:MAG: hypothetical protein IPI49_07750, partial [Myxococcales bacterium]|nr:hypothetical protein [Myxococcales bacterium]
MKSKRRISLQVKLAVALVLVVLTPLLVSAYLIDQLGKVAANFASSEAAARQLPMEHALATYRDLFDTTKRLHSEIADRLARQAVPTADLPRLLDREPGLVRVSLRTAEGTVVAEAARPLPGPTWREKLVDRPVPTGTLELAFAVRANLQQEYQDLKVALDGARRVSQIRSALPQGYRLTFLALIGIATLAAAGLGVGFSA